MDTWHTPPQRATVLPEQGTPKEGVPPQPLLLENGNGSKFCIGYTHLGQPGSWQPYNTPLGQPAGPLAKPPPAIKLLSDTKMTASPNSLPNEAAQSLPAKGAQTDHD
jgi:hypothetical protein